MATFRENGITIVDLFPSISAGANANENAKQTSIEYSGRLCTRTIQQNKYPI